MNWGYIGTKLATGLGLAAGKKAIKGYGKSWGLGYGSRGGFGIKRIGNGKMPRRKSYSKRRRYRPKLYGRQRGRMRISGYYGRYRGNRQEYKFHDIDLVDTAVAQGGTILVSQNLIAQGTTESERIGRKCTIRRIGWRYNFELLAQTDPIKGADVVRLIMYVDKQCNGAAAAVTDVLEFNDYQSFYNMSNQNRFRILMDRTISMNSSAGGGNGTTLDIFSHGVHGTFYKTCSIPIEFDSTTGALTEIRSNNIGVLIMSRDGSCDFDSRVRLLFTG